MSILAPVPTLPFPRWRNRSSFGVDDWPKILLRGSRSKSKSYYPSSWYGMHRPQSPYIIKRFHVGRLDTRQPSAVVNAASNAWDLSGSSLLLPFLRLSIQTCIPTHFIKSVEAAQPQRLQPSKTQLNEGLTSRAKTMAYLVRLGTCSLCLVVLLCVMVQGTKGHWHRCW